MHESTTTTSAIPLADAAHQLRIGWAAALGSLVVRQADGDVDSYAALLSDGALSDPLPREALASLHGVTAKVRSPFKRAGGRRPSAPVHPISS